MSTFYMTLDILILLDLREFTGKRISHAQIKHSSQEARSKSSTSVTHLPKLKPAITNDKRTHAGPLVIQLIESAYFSRIIFRICVKSPAVK